MAHLLQTPNHAAMWHDTKTKLKNMRQVRAVAGQRADVPAGGGARGRRGGAWWRDAAEPPRLGVPGGLQLPLHYAGGPVPQHR